MRSAPASALPLPAWAVAGLAALVVPLVWHGALAGFFAQDDYAGLARASGALPRLPLPWRWLSGQLYFDVMRAAAGFAPAGYHAVSLMVHAANAALLAAFLARRVTRPVALLAAVVYAAHPAAFTAVYSISGIGELLATTFALLTAFAFESSGARWLALPAFLASLMCKETTLLLPLALAFLPRRDETKPWRDPVLLGLAGLAVAFATVLVAQNSFGVRGGLAADAAYHAAPGAHVGANLLTYAGWGLDVAAPVVTSFMDAVDRRVWPLGAVFLGVLIAACVWRPAVERGGRAGAAWWLATLAFVLPLEHHTYHYYLVTPLVGGVVLLAALLAAVVTSVPSRARALSIGALAVAVALARSGAAIVARVEAFPFMDPRMRSDPTVDRGRIAAKVDEGLTRAALPPGTRLVFWSPRALQPGLTHEQATDRTRDTYWESNVRTALLDGLALRVLHPEVDSVRFVREYAPDSTSRWAVYGCDGLTNVVPDAELARMLAARPDLR